MGRITWPAAQYGTATELRSKSPAISHAVARASHQSTRKGDSTADGQVECDLDARERSPVEADRCPLLGGTERCTYNDRCRDTDVVGGPLPSCVHTDLTVGRPAAEVDCKRPTNHRLGIAQALYDVSAGTKDIAWDGQFITSVPSR